MSRIPIHRQGFGRAFTAAALLCAAATVIVIAQTPSETGTSPAATSLVTPRMANGKPDFSGTYQWPTYLPGQERGRSAATTFDRRNFAPLRQGGEPFIKPRTGNPRLDEPRDFCMPAGFPAGILSGNAMQFFQTSNYLVMVHEFQRMTRIIPLDGRPHRDGLEPMFYGDPVGRWEGDTLVIDTTNFKGGWQLDDYYYTNRDEYRQHSDALHTIERITWKSPTTLRYELTIDDPKVFERPWTQEFEIVAKPEWDKMGLFEYVCEENNRCPGGQCEANSN